MAPPEQTVRKHSAVPVQSMVHDPELQTGSQRAAPPQSTVQFPADSQLGWQRVVVESQARSQSQPPLGQVAVHCASVQVSVQVPVPQSEHGPVVGVASAAASGAPGSASALCCASMTPLTAASCSITQNPSSQTLPASQSALVSQTYSPERVSKAQLVVSITTRAMSKWDFTGQVSHGFPVSPSYP
jgi:hypothetical protein